MDKLKHFIACAVISLIVLIAFAVITQKEMYGWDKGIAVIVGFLAAAAKEVIWDKWLGKGTPDATKTLYTVPFTITNTTTIKWINILTGYENSHVNSRTITEV